MLCSSVMKCCWQPSRYVRVAAVFVLPARATLKLKVLRNSELNCQIKRCSLSTRACIFNCWSKQKRVFLISWVVFFGDSSGAAPCVIKGQHERAFSLFTQWRPCLKPINENYCFKLFYFGVFPWRHKFLSPKVPSIFFFSITYFESSHWKEKKKRVRIEMRPSVAQTGFISIYCREKKAQLVPTVIISAQICQHVGEFKQKKSSKDLTFVLHS